MSTLNKLNLQYAAEDQLVAGCLGARLALLVLEHWVGRRNPWLDDIVSVRPSTSNFPLENIALETGFKFTRYPGRLEVVGAPYTSDDSDDLREGLRRPDVSGVALGKKPGFFIFDLVGRDNPGWFREVILTTAELLKLGYRGRISFYSDAIRDSQYDNPERCEIFIGNTSEAMMEVRLQWRDSDHLIAPIREWCERMGFDHANKVIDLRPG